MLFRTLREKMSLWINMYFVRFPFFGPVHDDWRFAINQQCHHAPLVHFVSSPRKIIFSWKIGLICLFWDCTVYTYHQASRKQSCSGARANMDYFHRRLCTLWFRLSVSSGVYASVTVRWHFRIMFPNWGPSGPPGVNYKFPGVSSALGVKWDEWNLVEVDGFLRVGFLGVFP